MTTLVKALTVVVVVAGLGFGVHVLVELERSR